LIIVIILFSSSLVAIIVYPIVIQSKNYDFLQDNDIVVSKLYDSTEEGQKVTRNTGIKLVGVFRRIADPVD